RATDATRASEVAGRRCAAATDASCQLTASAMNVTSESAATRRTSVIGTRASTFTSPTSPVGRHSAATKGVPKGNALDARRADGGLSTRLARLFRSLSEQADSSPAFSGVL